MECLLFVLMCTVKIFGKRLVYLWQMAEKWDGSANDSPEVVYEGFSPPPTHHQGMINTASSSFVAADSNEDGSLGGSATAFMQTGPIVENQVCIYIVIRNGNFLWRYFI